MRRTPFKKLVLSLSLVLFARVFALPFGPSPLLPFSSSFLSPIFFSLSLFSLSLSLSLSVGAYVLRSNPTKGRRQQKGKKMPQVLSHTTLCDLGTGERRGRISPSRDAPLRIYFWRETPAI
jgi:hypothetical protein